MNDAEKDQDQNRKNIPVAVVSGASEGIGRGTAIEIARRGMHVVATYAPAHGHGSSDPILFAYYIVFSVCTAVMGLITRGLEAAIAFHTANNLVTTTINALFAGGGAVAVERSEGSAGGLTLLVPAAASLAALAMVWFRERARRTVERV